MGELKLLVRAMVRERSDIALAIVGGFVAGIAGVGLFSASGYLISRTVFAPPMYTLIVLASLVKILGLLRAVSRYGERLYSHRATFSLLSRLRTAFFAKLAPLVPGLYGKRRSGELLARFVGDVESLQNYFLRVAYPPLMLGLVFLATILFASLYSIWIAALFVLGMLIVAFAVPALVLLGYRHMQGEVREQRAALSAEVTEVLYGFRDLKVYGQMPQREQQLQQASAALVRAQQAAGRVLLRGQAWHAFTAFLITWAMLAVGALLIGAGSLPGVYLAMFVLAAMTVFDEAGALATLPAYKQDSEHAAQRLAEVVRAADDRPAEPAGRLQAAGADADSPRVVADSGAAAPQPPASADAQAISIALQGLTFQYADEWRPALRNVNLHIPAGAKVAIVGPSGSGKSTILQLVLKLYMPGQGQAQGEGQVLLNGMAVEALHEESIWRVANVVLQQSHFFRGTLRDNLLLDDAGGGARHTDEELAVMLEKVQLPGRALGSLVLEKGENLSDGEKQRLAMARAMLKGGRLWLLDEPASSLDAVTEQRVLRELLLQAKDDTVLLVCHRLSGLEAMDQIIVMEQGAVVEAGNYAELMARQGYFYEMKQIEQQNIGAVLPYEASSSSSERK